MKLLVAPWLTLPALQHLFDIFDKAGGKLRLVGGSVRDGLLNLPVSDLDFAVDHDPHWVMDLLKQNHIKVVPSGIDHGTVTAVIDKRPYQITTLRRDIETFGRKAHVAFTDDWKEDALRRDFTINAIYADAQGNLYDPVNGVEDLINHRVRFIGDASLRIKEDYLRTLRFFRFSARFGHEPYDAEGLKACTLYASHLPHLARERVTEEFLKLMEIPSPLYTLRAMHETGVLSYILHPATWEDLKSLVALEGEMKTAPSALLRLAAFHPLVDEVKKHLRLSKKQESTLNFYIKTHPMITESSFKQQAYRWGKEGTFNLALLQTARLLSQSEISPEDGVKFLKALHHQYDDWAPPRFPISGDDLLDRGVKEGRNVGRLLKAVEKWWLSQDLEPDRDACLAQLLTLL